MYIYLEVSLYVFLLHILIISSSSPIACSTCQESRTCYPPNCVCCKDSLPVNGTHIKDFPQIVYFTFDDAVTLQTAIMYRRLFSAERKNPNGCRIKFTLFVSHNYTDYRLVNDFYKQGMEIASHSINHRSDINLAQVREEILGQKDNLVRLGKVPEADVIGWRSPFLKPFGDKQVEILKEGGYIYDATLTYSKRRRKAVYPFTLDYGWPFHCQIPDCPQMQHPGFWEVPVVSVIDKDSMYDCVYTDGCTVAPTTYDEAYNYLWKNFLDYYNGNRAPMGINMHAAWFFYNYPTDPYRLKAMDQFIQDLLKKSDVYITTVKQMLEWVKNPVKISEINSMKSWQCHSSYDFIENSIQKYKYINIHRENLLKKQFKTSFEERYGAKKNRLYNISALGEDNNKFSYNIGGDSISDKFRMSPNKQIDYKETRVKNEEIKHFQESNSVAEIRKKPMQIMEQLETKNRELIDRNVNFHHSRNQIDDQSNILKRVKELTREDPLIQINTKVSLQHDRENKETKIYNYKQSTKTDDHSRKYSGSYFPRLDPTYHQRPTKDFPEQSTYKKEKLAILNRSEISFKPTQIVQIKTQTKQFPGQTFESNTHRDDLDTLTVQELFSSGSLMTDRNIGNSRNNRNGSGSNNNNSSNVKSNTGFSLDRQVLVSPLQPDQVWKTSNIVDKTNQVNKDFQSRFGIGNQNFNSRFSKKIPIKRKPVNSSVFKTCQQRNNCFLPDCRCMSTNVGTNKDNIPQFVYFTFDGPITHQFYYSMIPLFNSSYLNPRRCPIKATYFVSDVGSNYGLVRKLYDANMDISLQGNGTSFYSNITMLASDIQNQRFKMTHTAGIPASKIIGWRSPSMLPLGNDQMKILQREHFLYDSTLIYKQGYHSWPFTLDFGWRGTCSVGKCPTDNFNGFWEVPVMPFLDELNYTCLYADGCLFNPVTAKDTLDFLLRNFAVHYKDKIPLGVHLRHDWFNPSNWRSLKGLNEFISQLVNMSDVYIVSIAELIQWIKQPRTLQQMTKTVC